MESTLGVYRFARSSCSFGRKRTRKNLNLTKIYSKNAITKAYVTQKTNALAFSKENVYFLFKSSKKTSSQK
jgi:hypothetical protein